MKKTIRVLFVLMLSLLVSSVTFAATVSSANATMKLVQNNVCDISFGKYGTFEKKMVARDENNKTIDIKLTAQNNAKKPTTTTHEETTLNNAQIVLLIDNSNSMKHNITSGSQSGNIRKKVVIDSADKLIDSLYQQGKNIKIGVVSYATMNTQLKGSDADAKTVTPSLVDSADAAKSALDKVNSDNNEAESETDIEAGLDKAEKLLAASTDADAKKFIVLLTDGVPNFAYNVGPEVDTEKGGWKSAYDEKVIDPTVAKLKEVASQNITLFSCLINLADTELSNSTMDPKPTEREFGEKIFGTETSPTAGVVYYISDDEIFQTITESVFHAIRSTKTVTETHGEPYKLTDIVIKDYFPKNIIENFDYMQLTQSNIGNVTAKVDTKDNSITWTIPLLNEGETASFTYRLKLKPQFDSSILNINLPTNKDVTIDYKENGTQGPQKHNDKCPIVKLTTPSKPHTPTPTPTKDNTTAPPVPLPQTGSYLYISVITLVAVLGFVIGYAIYKNKKMTK